MGIKFIGTPAPVQYGLTRETYRTGNEFPVPPSQLADQATRADIAELAYLIWEEHGCSNGSAESDWLEAEQMVRERSNLDLV